MCVTGCFDLCRSLCIRRERKWLYKFNKFVFTQIGSKGVEQLLVRQDDASQLEMDSTGLVVKTKARRLLMLSDTLVCASGDGKNNVKWSVPIVEVSKRSSKATLLSISLSLWLKDLLTIAVNTCTSLVMLDNLRS